MSKVFTPTHSEGCAIAANFLKTKCNCGIVFIEPNPWGNSESPDAIGFRIMGVSILIEVKVSRADFMSDKNKPHRKDPTTGMGTYRFYACPEGVIKPEDLPPGWGLLYFTSRGYLKPIVAPHNITSLPSPQNVLRNIEHYRKRYSDEDRMVAHYLEELKFCFQEKNITGEINIMYGGYRQQCLASKAGKPVKIGEVFIRPEIS
ncbi:hypothetical protein G646_gp119 [Serratia phage phiMAM1]|uniref:Uncharacterized protein n=1 Tax=Serratia phage phiMAM1 TaxID=1262513 RepID=K7YB66_9CAUD|nr:hypothetical protein G646_gp119 [Serratia phage phiMAM1]AFX93587.1 hypothetical protein MAM_119 [Serratia phage phiMAM1]